MDKVRLGIIGMGNIGKYHADYLANRKVNRCELVAVCDAFAPLDRYKALKTSTDGEAQFVASHNGGQLTVEDESTWLRIRRLVTAAKGPS